MCKIRRRPSHQHSTRKCAVDRGKDVWKRWHGPPVGLAAEDLLFVIGSRHRLYGVTVDVGHLATEILALP